MFLLALVPISLTIHYCFISPNAMNKNIFLFRWCEQPNNFFFYHTFKFYRNFTIFSVKFITICACIVQCLFLSSHWIWKNNNRVNKYSLRMGSIEWLSKSFNFLSIIYDQCMRLSTPKNTFYSKVVWFLFALFCMSLSLFPTRSLIGSQCI